MLCTQLAFLQAQMLIPYLSGETSSKEALFSVFVCIRKEATAPSVSHAPCDPKSNIPVRTNCPTVAENPDKKALKGYKSPISIDPYISPDVTYIVSSNNTIHKLQDSNNDQKRHKHINQLRPLWRIVEVFLPYP